MKGEHSDPVILAVCARVRLQRRQRGLTQLELAQAAGLSEGTISRLEKNHEPPTLSSLVRLSRALEVPLEKLVTGRPMPAAKPPAAQERELRQLIETAGRLDRSALRQLLALSRLLGGRNGHRLAKKGRSR